MPHWQCGTYLPGGLGLHPKSVTLYVVIIYFITVELKVRLKFP